MKRILNFLRNDPTRAAAVASLIGVIISMFVKEPTLATALAGVFVTFLGLHQVVTPVTTMVEKVTEATTTAATETARTLGESTVGAVGELSNGAEEIIETIIDLTLGKVLTVKQRNGKGGH